MKARLFHTWVDMYSFISSLVPARHRVWENVPSPEKEPDLRCSLVWDKRKESYVAGVTISSDLKFYKVTTC